MRLIANAPINYSTGYGIDACQKLMGLIGLGHEVFIRASTWNVSKVSKVPYQIQSRRIHGIQSGEFELVIHPPGLALTPGKKSILCTTLESEFVSNHALDSMRKCDAIIVPCHWNMEILKSYGVDVPIYVCPQAVDESVFIKRDYPSNRKLLIGTAGNLYMDNDERKGFLLLIEAFKKAFNRENDVRLSIKTTSKFDADDIDDPRIECIRSSMTLPELSDWYAGLDVFASLSHGEAWGRMSHEAMATGRAVMSSSYGGPLEYIDPTCGYLVDGNIHPATGTYNGAGNWFHADMDRAVESLRKIRDHWYLGELEEKGRTASIKAMQFSQKACALRLEEILIERGALAKSRKIEGRTPVTNNIKDQVISYFKEREEIPRTPPSDLIHDCNLSIEPDGIGDALILSTHPVKWNAIGKDNRIQSPSKNFGKIKKWIPCMEHSTEGKGRWIGANKLLNMYDCGNGHFLQRLQRIFGLPVDDVPMPYLKPCLTQKRPNRVIIHTQPGGHANWQRDYIHPRAREVYAESYRHINRFIHSRGDLEFFEIGRHPDSHIIGAEDFTGLDIDQTIEIIQSSSWFLGIMSGPMHIATAFDLNCLVIVNMPSPEEIILPTLKNVPVVESEWFYPQHVYLHQEGDGPIAKRLSLYNLNKAFDMSIYPFFDHRIVGLSNFL